MIQPMTINMILPCVIGFIVLCVVIYNITEHESLEINSMASKTSHSIGCGLLIFIICITGCAVMIGGWLWKGCLYINTVSKGHLLPLLCVVCLFIFVYFLIRKNLRMLEKLLMNSEEKEFAKITRDLVRDKYIALKAYFKATGTSFDSANKFLKSCRGVAFLEAYKKSRMIDNTEISKMILDVEREEQIISCAVDILKLYS